MANRAAPTTGKAKEGRHLTLHLGKMTSSVVMAFDASDASAFYQPGIPQGGS